MVANGGNVLVESFSSSPSLVSCCSLGKLIRPSNFYRKFMASGFGLCVACLFLAVLDDRRDHVFQDGTRYAEPFSAAVDPQPPLSGRSAGQARRLNHHAPSIFLRCDFDPREIEHLLVTAHEVNEPLELIPKSDRVD